MPLTFLGYTLRPRWFLRELQFAFAALRSDDAAERRLLERVLRDPELSRRLASLPAPTDVDRAEDGIVTFGRKRWREEFCARLTGHGLEIGPLHRPMPLPSGATVDYLDLLTVDELRKEYPELRKHRLTEPTIIGDAQRLVGIGDRTCDFVIAAHVIEHMRNPIGALREWCRVTRPGGLLYLVVPEKRRTFDKTRPRTSLEHLLLDDSEPSEERDFEHFVDYAVHAQQSSGAPAIERARQLRDTGYSIHCHVFIPADIVKLAHWFDQHVHGLELVDGPATWHDDDEFHVLLRVGQRRERADA